MLCRDIGHVQIPPQVKPTIYNSNITLPYQDIMGIMVFYPQTCRFGFNRLTGLPYMNTYKTITLVCIREKLIIFTFRIVSPCKGHICQLGI